MAAGDHFILDGRVAVPVDLMTWARWLNNADRVVAKDSIGDVRVSTVFLGLDHSFGQGPPLLFETMIFGGEHASYQDRCTTYDEAEAMHARAIAMVKP